MKLCYPSKTINGVYVLPSLVNNYQIQEILKLNEIKSMHHSDDEGHGGGGHDTEEKAIKFKADKPYKLTWLSDIIYKHIPYISVPNMSLVGVDEYMQLYRLNNQTPAVPKHVDEDFVKDDGDIALYSVLVYLNDNYVGGETIFKNDILAPQVEIGGGLVFKHDILHEGLKVIEGIKYVIKTDVLFKQN